MTEISGVSGHITVGRRGAAGSGRPGFQEDGPVSPHFSHPVFLDPPTTFPGSTALSNWPHPFLPHPAFLQGAGGREGALALQVCMNQPRVPEDLLSPSLSLPSSPSLPLPSSLSEHRLLGNKTLKPLPSQDTNWPCTPGPPPVTRPQAHPARCPLSSAQDCLLEQKPRACPPGAKLGRRQFSEVSHEASSAAKLPTPPLQPQPPEQEEEGCLCGGAPPR